MVLVILGISLLILIVGIVFCAMKRDYWTDNLTTTYKRFRKWLYLNDWVYYTLNGVGATISSIALIAALILGIYCSREKAIDNQIQIYQEENTNIENTVAEIVSNYQEYEQETFKSFTPEKIMAAVNLYPELKSNDLVVKQLDIHANNNEKIKSLKSQKAELTTYKWWLYFGE
jgi:hypothetical protein